MNNVKTGLLLIALSGLLVWIGGMIGGASGARIALVLAIAMNFFAYWFSDRMVLSMYRAQEVGPDQAPELHRMVAELADRAGLPMPRVYVIPTPSLNAFATGRNPQHAAVAVTEGLMRTLSPRELAGVMAHELSHVRHRDILIGTIAATLVGAISWIGQMAQWNAIFGGGDRGGQGGNLVIALLVSMVGAMAATMIQLAISRSREFEADAGAARLLGEAEPLMSALRKLELGAERLPMQANPASAHLFIVSPLRGGSGIGRWFRTHPPIEERIQRLSELRLDDANLRWSSGDGRF